MLAELHPRAHFDIRRSRSYYKRIRPAVLKRFMEELHDAIGRIEANPKAWALHLHGTRICPFRQYPHYLVYTEDASRIFIVAVAHNRRRVDYWKRRLP